jgi:hypothetical protein
MVPDHFPGYSGVERGPTGPLASEAAKAVSGTLPSIAQRCRKELVSVQSNGRTGYAQLCGFARRDALAVLWCVHGSRSTVPGCVGALPYGGIGVSALHRLRVTRVAGAVPRALRSWLGDWVGVSGVQVKPRIGRGLRAVSGFVATAWAAAPFPQT